MIRRVAAAPLARSWVGPLVAAGLLAGCTALPDVVGAGAAIASGSFTANPVVGVAIGLSTAAATDAALRYYDRVRHRHVQDAIATAAGPLGPNEAGAWATDHTIPYGNARGEVRLVRAIDNPLAACREIAFSVVDGEGANESRQWFVAHLCRDDDRWRWASAEPAVQRWGALQ